MPPMPRAQGVDNGGSRMTNNIEQLKIAELKSRLCQAAKKSQETMAPLLYYLRQKIKAQGSRNDLLRKAEGFGQWVEAHLDISRRTADRWANEWAVSKGLRKLSKSKPTTFRQKSKSEPNKFVASLTMSLSKERHVLFVEALKILGNDAAEQVIYDAVITAAEGAKKKPAQSVKGSERQKLTSLEDEANNSLLRTMEKQTAVKGAGQ